MTIQAKTVPALAPGVRLRRDPARDGWALLGPEKVLQPDEITAAVLARVDGRASLAEIIASLAQEYDGDPAEIAADVDQLLQALEAGGWVVRQ